jgi:signal transduction histidine kinase
MVATSTALLSIVAFWAFYFAVNTLRSIVNSGLADQVNLFGQRIVVSLISGGATLLLYWLLRRSHSPTMKRNIVRAAVLAVPAAFLYSSVNYVVFDRQFLTHPVIFVSSPTDPLSLSIGVPEPDEDMTPAQYIVGDAVSGYFFFATWAALFLLLCYGVEVRALERRAAALRAAAQSAELRALRYQVNPHFLFNTLNSLSSLVLAGRNAAAERMIAGLSDFFRTSMAGDPTAEVPLSEEIFLQRLYLDIEAARFPDRLAVAIDVPDAVQDVPVPGLILQPLIENAVKHGVARSRKRVTIRIGARRVGDTLLIEVADYGDAVTPDANGSGVGLRNVRERLAARYGDAATLDAGPGPHGGHTVRLSLPIGHDGD